MFKYIDQIPLFPLVVVAFFMMLAPFAPEPHLLEKTRMLINGELTKALDIFDLFWHSLFIMILLLRLFRLNKAKNVK